MATPAEGAKDLLVTAAVASVNGASGYLIRLGRLTEGRDEMVVVRDSGAAQNPDPKWLLDYPTIQVMVRGAENDYTGAFAKIIACRDVLLGLEAQTVNGDRWDAVTGLGGAMLLHYDEKNRPVLTHNFRIILEPATTALTNRQPL